MKQVKMAKSTAVKSFVFLLVVSILFSFSFTGKMTTNAATSNEEKSYSWSAGKNSADTGWELSADDGFTITNTVSAFGIDSESTTKEKRAADNNYLSMTFSGVANGFKVKFFMLNDNSAGSDYNKMQADLYLLQGETESYVETVDTFKNVIGEHTLSFKKVTVGANEYTYITVDGVSFTPNASMNYNGAFSLSVEANTTDKAEFKLSVAAGGSAPVYGEWSTFGQTNVKENADGTTEFNLKDGRATQYNGTPVVYMRERVVNLKGYDVTKPIVLEFCYDHDKAMGVWYGLCMGRTAFGDLFPMQYKLSGEDAGDFEDAEIYGVNFKLDVNEQNMRTSDGVMIQTVNALVQSTNHNADIPSYFTNKSGPSYVNSADLDVVEILVGEETTTLKYNGKVLFGEGGECKGLDTKRSDFPDGKMYPYFEFIGTPASPVKENKITIKGVNAPVYSSNQVKTLYKGADGSTDFAVDNYDNTNGNLKLYYDGAKTSAVEESKYSYNAANKTLTIQNDVFSVLNYGANKLYVANDGGVTEINITLKDANVVAVNPEVRSAQLKDGEIYIEVDLKGAELSRFFGGGISKANYELTEENGKTYIVIKSAFVSVMKDSDYTFTVETVNVNEDKANCKVTIDKNGRIKTGEEQEAPDSSSDSGKKGCGSYVSAENVMLMLSGMFAVVFVLIRRKNKRI